MKLAFLKSVGHLVTGCTRTGSLDDVRKKQQLAFSSTKLLTRVTVADKLVFVDPFR